MTQKASFLGLIGAIVVGTAVYYYFTLPKTVKKPVLPPVKQSEQNVKKEVVTLNASNPLEIDDYSLKNVRLGDSLNTVIQKLGNPNNKKQTSEGLLNEYGDLEVTVNQQNTVINITADKAAVSTRRGIHVGSSFEEIKQAYGDGFKKTAYNELDLYEYTFSPTPNNGHILRFAVERNSNTVKYIGMRILAAVETTEGKKDTVISRFYGTWYMNGPTTAESGHIAITENAVVYIPLHDADRIPKNTWKRKAYSVSSINVNPDTGIGYAILKFDDGTMNRFNLQSDRTMTWDKAKYVWEKKSSNTNY